MAYSVNYQGLIADILLWMGEESDEFTEQLDAIIMLGETRLLRDLDLQAFSAFVTAPTITIGVSPQTRETTLVVVKDAFYGLTNKPLLKRSFPFVTAYNDGAALGAPVYWAEANETQYALSPPPDAIYAINFYGIVRPTGLSEAHPTSWLSTNVGDLLLKACLIEGENYLIGTAPVAKWKAEYQDALIGAKHEFGQMTRPQFLGS